MGKMGKTILRTLVLCISTAITVAILTGCGRRMASKVAPKNIGQSFSVVHPIKNRMLLGSNQHDYISIDRAALGKEFLLQGELIDEIPVAWGNSIRSRIVTFIKRNDNVDMLESDTGNSVTTELPQSLLLASFPIKSSDKHKIVFDFNTGMSRLFVESDMAMSDFAGSKYNQNQEFQSVGINNSYIASARVEDTNTVHRLVIRQIAQLSAGDNNGVSVPVEVRYYLSPYRPDPTYKPFQHFDNFTHYGYFEVQPQMTSEGDSIQYAERWNPRKLPIVYAISANTPPQFLQAVKDGALYWNHVLGRPIIKLVMAPKGITAPNPDYNMIQWVPYNTAPMSYADIQADPRTGEILHAQVYITSAFVANSIDNVRYDILQLIASSTHPQHVSTPTVGLSGFINKPLCDYDGTVGLKGAITSMIKTSASPTIIEQAAADEIRVTVAHEIGHTLGLRHNFAGSLAANYTMSERNNLIRSYLKTGRTPKGVIITSSVMDYMRVSDDFMLGDQIAHGIVLSHDRATIRFLYDGIRPQKWPLYCTDSALGQLYDCKQFDAGSSEVAYMAYHSRQFLKYLPNFLIETYIGAKTPYRNQLTTPVNEVVLPNPKSLAHYVLAPRLSLMKQFTKAAGIVSVQRQFAAVGGFDAKAIQSAQAKYVLNQIEQNGGFKTIFAFLPDNFTQVEMSRLNALLQGRYHRGIGYNNRNFAFSPAEMATIENNSRLFFKAFQHDFNKQNLALLAGNGMGNLKFLRGSLSNAFGNFLANVETTILFKASPASVTVHVHRSLLTALRSASLYTSATANLSVFDDPLNFRLTAARLLTASRSVDPMWMFYTRARLKFAFNDLLKNSFGLDPATLNLENLPPYALQWLAENKKVQAILNNSGP